MAGVGARSYASTRRRGPRLIGDAKRSTMGPSHVAPNALPREVVRYSVMDLVVKAMLARKPWRFLSARFLFMGVIKHGCCNRVRGLELRISEGHPGARWAGLDVCARNFGSD